MLIELAANERAVHGDFFNSKKFFLVLGLANFRGTQRRFSLGFHCHAIKIKIKNHSLNEVKKLTRYRP